MTGAGERKSTARSVGRKTGAAGLVLALGFGGFGIAEMKARKRKPWPVFYLLLSHSISSAKGSQLQIGRAHV